MKVQDNGIGIKAEDLPKMFQLFGFLEATQEINSKGVGLGLHICKKIAEVFGGEVFVDSQENVGSTFGVTFQLDQR